MSNAEKCRWCYVDELTEPKVMRAAAFAADWLWSWKLWVGLVVATAGACRSDFISRMLIKERTSSWCESVADLAKEGSLSII